MELSDRVKQRREELNITQDELAKRMGYSSRSSINKIEKGRAVTQKIIYRLAKALDTTPSYLMGWDEEEKEEPKETFVGSILKSLRSKRNLTMLEVAEEMNITVEDIQDYENGIKKVPVELLGLFAKYYNIELDELMGIDLESSRKHIVITDNPILNERYKKWQSIVGYNRFNDEEIDKLIDYAKFLIASREE